MRILVSSVVYSKYSVGVERKYVDCVKWEWT